jgi:hypothetical protein
LPSGPFHGLSHPSQPREVRPIAQRRANSPFVVVRRGRTDPREARVQWWGADPRTPVPPRIRRRRAHLAVRRPPMQKPNTASGPTRASLSRIRWATVASARISRSSRRPTRRACRGRQPAEAERSSTTDRERDACRRPGRRSRKWRRGRLCYWYPSKGDFAHPGDFALGCNAHHVQATASEAHTLEPRAEYPSWQSSGPVASSAISASFMTRTIPRSLLSPANPSTMGALYRL